MEKKERYEIHMYDDCCVDLYDNGVLDKSITDQWELEKLLNKQNARIKELEEENQQLKQQLEESEKETKHWHGLYKYRDNQFQSVRQRYHLLNKLQSDYTKKDKLHLLQMQCLELVEENEKLKQSQKQLAISELEKVKEYIVLNDKYDEEIGCNIIETFDLLESLADKIKSLKGENNVKD